MNISHTLVRNKHVFTYVRHVIVPKKGSNKYSILLAPHRQNRNDGHPDTTKQLNHTGQMLGGKSKVRQTTHTDTCTLLSGYKSTHTSMQLVHQQENKQVSV